MDKPLEATAPALPALPAGPAAALAAAPDRSGGQGTAAGQPGGAAAAVPQLTDLRCPADELAMRLGNALRSGADTDGYLLAAGLCQVIEDRLHPDPFQLQRAAGYLGKMPGRGSRLAGRAAGGLGGAVRAWPAPSRRRLAAARHALLPLTAALARRVLGLEQVSMAGDVLAVPQAVLAATADLRGDVLRIPACFHGFDQHPDDVIWLAREFTRRYPAGWTPLCVLGVRTSGSYLAPLLAAALRAAGAPWVEVLTCRPGRPLLRWERAVLAGVAREGGVAVVTSDPPGAGTWLAAAACTASRAGFPDRAIVLVYSSFSSFGDSGYRLPLLSRWPAVVQPWNEWSIHQRTGVAPVRAALAALAGPGARVDTVRLVEYLADPGRRAHVRARYTVRLTETPAGPGRTAEVVAEGVGLGFFGRQAAAVAAALPGFVPHVYGFIGGLLFRDWLPAAERRPAEGQLADAVCGYVAARARQLPAPGAASRRLARRNPAWETAAALLSPQFGRLAVPSRPLLLEPVMQRLLRHDDAAVVDGKTGPRHWFPDPREPGSLLKTDFCRRAFGHLDLACYDPVFDLAGAAADQPRPLFEARLRTGYQRVTRKQIDGERWLLYRLVQVWRLEKGGDIAPAEAGQRSASAVHDYLAGLYLGGLAPPDGPLCAIELGVLEGDRLGYPATSPTGALCLRALTAHGYRPVLASGRPLPDVAARCEAFGLAGGVAEHGAVIWHSASAADLRPRPAGRPLHRVQARPAERGSEVPQAVLAEGQAGITAAGFDKGTGLRALAARLGHPGCALAVGDSAADLPLLAQAGLAFAPRTGRSWARGTGISVSRRTGQGGLAEACAALLGHRPGGCPVCRPPDFPGRTRAVLSILDLRSGGTAVLAARAAALAVLAARRSRW